VAHKKNASNQRAVLMKQTQIYFLLKYWNNIEQINSLTEHSLLIASFFSLTINHSLGYATILFFAIIKNLMLYDCLLIVVQN